MRGFLSFVIAAVVTMTALVVVTAERFFDEITDTEKLLSSVRSARIHTHLIDYGTQQIIAGSAFQQLQGSALALSEAEVRTLLERTFPEDWFITAVKSAHLDLIEPLQGQFPETGRSGKFILTDKKELLSENFFELIKTKLDNLPQCSPERSLRMGISYLKQGNRLNLKSLNITCQPSKEFQPEIHKILRSEIAKGITIVPDTVDFGKMLNSSKKIEERYDELKRGARFMRNFKIVGYIILVAGLIIIALINLSSRKKMFFRTGFPLVLTGLLLGVSFGLILQKFNDPSSGWNFKLSTPQSDLSASDQSTMNMALSFGQSLASNYFWDMIYFSIFIFLSGAAFMVAGRMINEPRKDGTLSP